MLRYQNPKKQINKSTCQRHTEKNNKGKAQNKSTPNSTNPRELSYNEISLEGNQDTDLRRTTVDIYKEIKKYKKQIRELKGENDKL